MKSSAASLSFLVVFCAMVLGLSVFGGSVVSAREQAAPAAKVQDHPEFPPGPGRDLTLTKCSKCHSPNILLATGRSQQGWEEIITKMTTLGLQGTDEEFTTILDYVTASFPVKVNVNKAAAPELASVLGLTPEEAAAIVAYRAKNGDYKTVDDLKKVTGVDAQKLDAKKNLLQF